MSRLPHYFLQRSDGGEITAINKNIERVVWRGRKSVESVQHATNPKGKTSRRVVALSLPATLSSNRTLIMETKWTKVEGGWIDEDGQFMSEAEADELEALAESEHE